MLGSQPKTTEGSRYVVVITDRYTSLKNGIPTTITNATTVTRMFFGYWMADYSISCKLLADNSPQFEPIFFVAVCSTLRVDNVAATEYLLQTKDNTESVNNTPLFQLRYYASEQQTDGYKYLLQLSYAHSLQMRRSSKVSHLS